MGFLGYIISGNDICMDLHKIQTIVGWTTKLLFEMFNVFLDLPTFINASLLTILQ